MQGIDISFSMDKEMSMVERCTIVGVREGIVTHMSMVDVEHNLIGETSLRGITMGEMSMGAIRNNDVLGAHGVGIICLDHSECDIPPHPPQAPSWPLVGPAAQRRRHPGALLRQGSARGQHGGREPRRHRGARQLHYHPEVSTPPSFLLVARTGHPDFLDLPWGQPLEEWQTQRFVNLIRGISRHTVRFVEYDGTLYALKELPERPARREWTLLGASRARACPWSSPSASSPAAAGTWTRF